MSAKGRRSDYIILATLAVGSAAVLLAIAVMGGVRDEDSGKIAVRTTHSTNVEGLAIVYTLFERLGISVRRCESPLTDEVLGHTDVLFLIDPLVPVQGGEYLALSRWVQSGGVLVCTSRSDAGLDRIHQIEGGSSWEGRTGGRSRPGSRRWVRRYSDGVKSSAEESTEAYADLPLAPDVSEAHFDSSAVLDVAAAARGPGRGPAERLFADSVGVRIASRRVGVGRVIVLSDSSFLANGQVGKKDNAILGVNLVSYAASRARGSRVAFEEYHFGYGSRETGWGVLTGMLFQTSPGWAILSLTTAGLLYLVYKGRRLGTRRAPKRPRRRSKLEYVHAVGATYRATGANRLTLRAIYEWFVHESARRVGLPASAPTGEIAARLARQTGASPGRYSEVLQCCERALGGPRLTSRNLLALLHQLAEIESEIANGHPKGK